MMMHKYPDLVGIAGRYGSPWMDEWTVFMLFSLLMLALSIAVHADMQSCIR
jgi:hypothetical protein